MASRIPGTKSVAVLMRLLTQEPIVTLDPEHIDFPSVDPRKRL